MAVMASVKSSAGSPSLVPELGRADPRAVRALPREQVVDRPALRGPGLARLRGIECRNTPGRVHLLGGPRHGLAQPERIRGAGLDRRDPPGPAVVRVLLDEACPGRFRHLVALEEPPGAPETGQGLGHARMLRAVLDHALEQRDRLLGVAQTQEDQRLVERQIDGDGLRAGGPACELQLAQARPGPCADGGRARLASGGPRPSRASSTAPRPRPAHRAAGVPAPARGRCPCGAPEAPSGPRRSRAPRPGSRRSARAPPAGPRRRGSPRARPRRRSPRPCRRGPRRRRARPPRRAAGTARSASRSAG